MRVVYSTRILGRHPYRSRTPLLWFVLVALSLDFTRRHPSKPPSCDDDDSAYLSTDTKREIKRVPAGEEPHNLIATPDDRFLVIGIGPNVLMFPDRRAHTSRMPRICIDSGSHSAMVHRGRLLNPH